MASRKDQISHVIRLAESVAEKSESRSASEHDPQLFQAIEQVLRLLEQTAISNPDLTALIEASRQAVEREQNKRSD